jgi:hypothetical protein
MVVLAGESCGAGASFEPVVDGDTVIVVLRCASMTTDQVKACSGSCCGDGRVTCSDAGKTYTGKCEKLCVQEHGCTCHIGGCSCS